MEMNWISIQDERPKIGQPVLLRSSTGIVQEQTYYRDCCDESDFWQDVGDNHDGVPINPGDSWMYLPKGQ
ncbi:hypothetical protein [Aeromonas sp. MrichA-1]|uniref:hypothetical protein n=1 Tax=Aeromonas sp. MrichA-1 TaxID=2823362 RepID=UPI001B34200B|nr:hypothetical protein [Aeromonas sp. MrichA-1]MBP4081285.1 hypothetical protein [Aeromonas sp. MrichA-1]